MKLRNKKTGQIVELELVVRNNDYLKDVIVETFYNEEPTIKKLYEDWEDYEEPKEYWYLNEYLELDHEIWTDTEFDNKLKSIGNYFETKEEAEKAVKKLKAWKRLKDKGFKFINYNCPFREIYFEVDEENFFGASGEASEETCADLAILFGGEDD